MRKVKKAAVSATIEHLMGAKGKGKGKVRKPPMRARVRANETPSKTSNPRRRKIPEMMK